MPTPQHIAFGPFQLDTRTRQVQRQGVPLAIGGRSFDLLAALAQAGGETASKQALLDQVWPNQIVEENNLQVHVSALRKALGEGWIITVPGHGYRLLTPDQSAPSALDKGTGKPSIAVLPFLNLSDDIQQEYLADGIAEDILTELSRNRGLTVIARNSSFSYRGRAVDLLQVSQELGVRYVLHGSVRPGGTHVRASLQLSDAEQGIQIWGERFDGEQRDLFAFQDKTTQAVIAAIVPALADAEMQRAVRSTPKVLDAWHLYHQGMWHLRKHDAADNAQARTLFERAIAQDGMFVPAHIGLARTYIRDGAVFLTMEVGAAMQSAREHGQRAMQLDPADAEARAILASALHHTDQMSDAVAIAQEALTINPNCAQAYRALGSALIFSGRTAEGREAIREFVRLSPRDSSIPHVHNQVALSHYFERDYERCIAVGRHQLATHPGFTLTHRWLAAALGQIGRQAEAREALETAIARSPREFETYATNRVPWMRPEDHAHMLEGLRKAGWQG